MKFCTECGNRVSSRPVAHDSHQRYVCDSCFLVHYQNPRVLVAAAVFWRGKLLMCRRAHEPALGKWVTPSGYLECGETLQEAAARETFEEAGVSLDPAKMELYAIVNAPDIDQVRVLFRIDLLEELTVKPGPESLEALFMSEEQIREVDLAWPASSRRAMQMLFAQHRAGNFDIHLMSVGAQHPNSLNARSYPIAHSAPKRGTSPVTGGGLVLESVNSSQPMIVGIGGTARPNSTSERAVIEALRTCERLGAKTRLFDGSFISRMPLYIPDRVERTDAELEFVAAVRNCHGVIVGTPGYHGSLSGPIKNILDLLEDTARDERPYLDGRAFGCVVTAYGWQACGTTLVSLRMIAHALRAWPTPFGAALNASTPLFETDGTCIDPKTSQQLATVASQVVEFAAYRAAAHAGKPSGLAQVGHTGSSTDGESAVNGNCLSGDVGSGTAAQK